MIYDCHFFAGLFGERYCITVTPCPDSSWGNKIFVGMAFPLHYTTADWKMQLSAADCLNTWAWQILDFRLPNTVWPPFLGTLA